MKKFLLVIWKDVARISASVSMFVVGLIAGAFCFFLSPIQAVKKMSHSKRELSFTTGTGTGMVVVFILVIYIPIYKHFLDFSSFFLLVPAIFLITLLISYFRSVYNRSKNDE